MVNKNQTVIEKLIAGCQAGNLGAQEELYKLYYGYAMGISLRYSNSREEAKEITNDAFLAVFLQLKKGINLKAFKPWFRRILINIAVDRFRKDKSKGKTIEIGYADLEEDAYSILDELSEKEIIELVQKLSPAYRMVFNLYIIEGFSHKEISEKLNIAVSTSKANLSKAKARLKKLLHQLDSEIIEQYG